MPLQHLHKGVYIYKNGKKQVFKSEEVDSLVFFDTDNSTTPSVTGRKILNFLQPISQKLLQNLSNRRGKSFTATQPNSGKLILEKTVNGKTVHWEYNGNGQGVYMYAKSTLETNKIDAFKAFLRKQGYELETKASLNNDVKVYVNKNCKKQWCLLIIQEMEQNISSDHMTIVLHRGQEFRF